MQVDTRKQIEYESILDSQLTVSKRGHREKRDYVMVRVFVNVISLHALHRKC